MGDGETIDIRRDHWGMEGIMGEAVCQTPLMDNERKVKDLWDNRNGRWKREGKRDLW